MEQPLKSRARWSSLFAFIWVCAGAAVGLGNVWKFPYMVGSFGGSAFVLMYLFFVALIAMPVMAAEIMLGKLSQKNAVDGFSYLAKLHKRSQNWRFMGVLGLVTLQLIFCFYSVVAGWSVAYLYFGFTNSFFKKTKEEVQAIWVGFLGQPLFISLCTVIFVVATMAIVFFGVKKGIERACTLMMPGLLAILVFLVIYGSFSDGFSQAFSFLFAFEPQKIESGVIIASLGHAFFTLAVGACAMMVYGSYLPKGASVAKSVCIIALLDVAVALLAGLAIFPLIFEHGLAPNQGPGLMFVTLPMAFTTMPFGWFFACLFFVLLFFAALSSSLSFAEPLVDFIMERFAFSRHKAVLLVGLITLIGALICGLSFNVLSDNKLFGHWGIFDAVADLSTNILLPIGGILISIFAGLIIKKVDLFPAPQKHAQTIFLAFRILTLYVAPCAIAVVLIHGLMDIITFN